MAAYMITYDLNSEGQNYEKVIQSIKDSSNAWCSYWKSSYLIKSNLTVQQVSDNITQYLDGNDRFIIIEVKDNYQGWLSKNSGNLSRKTSLIRNITRFRLTIFRIFSITIFWHKIDRLQGSVRY